MQPRCETHGASACRAFPRTLLPLGGGGAGPGAESIPAPQVEGLVILPPVWASGKRLMVPHQPYRESENPIRRWDVKVLCG